MWTRMIPIQKPSTNVTSVIKPFPCVLRTRNTLANALAPPRSHLQNKCPPPRRHYHQRTSPQATNHRALSRLVCLVSFAITPMKHLSTCSTTTRANTISTLKCPDPPADANTSASTATNSVTPS
uniref:Uncharacterized protein n=1 Tax=Cacopsylla melanoneura TaxID=428564 RepID=A0A8D8Q6P8_9HEMI